MGKPSVEFLVASISSFILLIIVPTVNYAKFVDLSSYVISMGIIASIIGPNVNYFLVNFPILLGITFFCNHTEEDNPNFCHYITSAIIFTYST
ncbi:hypothetical protein [Sulfuracidifex metallicus]|uniref:hypothetical protein n=1 Tax=Sulfuracidifex metallicus TaxID=47303 RepID=UPI000AFFF396|nr:hypothetical protein [Sulfuracidifex metallicus]